MYRCQFQILTHQSPKTKDSIVCLIKKVHRPQCQLLFNCLVPKRKNEINEINEIKEINEINEINEIKEIDEINEISISIST